METYLLTAYIVLGLLVGSFDTFIGLRKGMLQDAIRVQPVLTAIGLLVAFFIWPLTVYVLVTKWDGKFK